MRALLLFISIILVVTMGVSLRHEPDELVLNVLHRCLPPEVTKLNFETLASMHHGDNPVTGILTLFSDGRISVHKGVVFTTLEVNSTTKAASAYNSVWVSDDLCQTMEKFK